MSKPLLTDNKLIFQVNKEQLSDSYLTKMASVQAVNSSTALLTQSLSILLDVMDRYVDVGVLIYI